MNRFKNLNSYMALIIVFIVAAFYFDNQTPGHNILAAMMAILAVILLFGVLKFDKDYIGNEITYIDKIRLALTATIIVEFFIYFGSVVFLKDEVATASDNLIEILATIIGAVFAFYFSAEAAKRISQNISKRKINEAKYHALGKIAEVELAAKKPKTDQIIELFGKISQDDKK